MNRTAGVLLIEGGHNDGDLIPLIGGENTMGRELTNNAVDTETGVSRLHAEIIETESGYYVHDLSTNGTYVNDKKISREENTLLIDGDRIGLGPSTIRFVLRSDTARTGIFDLPENLSNLA